MPYPNEHACRLEDPGKYERVRRVNRDIDVNGKADAIYGILPGGGSELQAVRFPTARFDADEARAWCRAHGGSFEAAGPSS